MVIAPESRDDQSDIFVPRNNNLPFRLRAGLRRIDYEDVVIENQRFMELPEPAGCKLHWGSAPFLWAAIMLSIGAGGDRHIIAFSPFVAATSFSKGMATNWLFSSFLVLVPRGQFEKFSCWLLEAVPQFW